MITIISCRVLLILLLLLVDRLNFSSGFLSNRSKQTKTTIQLSRRVSMASNNDDSWDSSWGDDKTLWDTDSVSVSGYPYPESNLLATLVDKIEKQKARGQYRRSYVAKKETFIGLFNRTDPFILEDIMFASPQGETTKTLLSLGRFTVIATAFAFFPFIVKILLPISDSGASGEVAVTGAVLPGIGILFGSLLSITYSILLGRLSNLQNLASKESSKLSTLAHDINSILRDDPDRRLAALKCVKKHANVLIYESRANELLMMMNEEDPLLQLQSIINDVALTPCNNTRDECYVEKGGGERKTWTKVTSGASQVIDVWPLRSALTSIFELRAARVSQEAVSLPSIHFWLLAYLSIYQLLGFAMLTADNTIATSTPFPYSLENRIEFSILAGVFALSINFALDLNQPFEGAYQVRRSSSSAFLLQTLLTVGDFEFENEENE